MPRGYLLLAAASLAFAQSSPAWWRQLKQAPRLEANFIQASESQVFGTLKRSGVLKAQKGSGLVLSYVDGKRLVADRQDLVHYDPDARTAQRMDLRSGMLEMPLLKLLLEPAGLGGLYDERPQADGRLLLDPRRPGLPRLLLSGQGSRLGSIEWQDPTGAKQVLSLQGLAYPANPFPPATFRFQPPAGTRWLNERLR